MPNSVVQQIKDKLNIIDVVSSYLKLEKTGINFRAPCPFHSEKKPSFFVSPTRQSFKCFGCGASGSVFDFIMQIEGIEFGDALKILAKRAGVQLEEYHPELKTKRQRLYEICELSCQFFEKQLETEKGKKVLEYLKKRKLTQETIKKWRIGYSLDMWRTLSDFLVSKGYNRMEILEAGMAVKSEKGSYDRFRGRIMFPIFDLSSQVVGFGGRVFEKQEDTAKYLNIQNTLLYDKSKTLYGLNFGKMDTRKKDYCILTEGYMDVISSHQAGFSNTVAASGTSLTPFQLKILKRYTNNILFSFDMDSAGSLATKRGIDLAQKEGFDIKVIAMPHDKDPADVIAENPGEWEKLVKNAKEIMDFYFDDAFHRFDQETSKGKKEISEQILPLIRKVPNKILQFHFINKLSKALKVSEESVVGELKNIITKKDEETKREVTFNQKKARGQLLEEKIIALIFRSNEQLQYVLDEDIELFSPAFQIILTCLKEEKDIKKACLKIEKKESHLKTVIDDCVFKSEMETEENIDDEFQVCLSAFRDFSSKERLKDIGKEIEQVEREGNEEKLLELMQTFNKMIKS